jgi:hypothetical protein
MVSSDDHRCSVRQEIVLSAMLKRNLNMIGACDVDTDDVSEWFPDISRAFRATRASAEPFFIYGVARTIDLSMPAPGRKDVIHCEPADYTFHRETSAETNKGIQGCIHPIDRA